MKTLKYFLFLACFIAKSTLADQVSQKFLIESSIFNNSQGSISYDLDSNHYSVTSSIRTNGFLNKFYSYSATYQSKGKIKGAKTIAQTYQYESTANSKKRTKQITMDKNGNPIHRKTVKNSKTKEADIEISKKQFDAPDMQTAFILLIRQFMKNNFCDMEKIIYDGKKNYKMIFQDLGKTTLDDAKIKLSGDIYRCALKIESLKEEDQDFLWEMTSKNPINFWIVKDRKTHLPYIAKIQIDSTPIGSIKAYNIENHLLKE